MDTNYIAVSLEYVAKAEKSANELTELLDVGTKIGDFTANRNAKISKAQRDVHRALKLSNVYATLAVATALHRSDTQPGAVTM